MSNDAREIPSMDTDGTMRSPLSAAAESAELTSSPAKPRTSSIPTAPLRPTDWRYSLLICDRCGGPLVIYGEDGFLFDDPIWLYPNVDDLN
jgi:hypothetical protein